MIGLLALSASRRLAGTPSVIPCGLFWWLALGCGILHVSSPVWATPVGSVGLTGGSSGSLRKSCWKTVAPGLMSSAILSSSLNRVERYRFSFFCCCPKVAPWVRFLEPQAGSQMTYLLVQSSPRWSDTMVRIRSAQISGVQNSPVQRRSASSSSRSQMEVMSCRSWGVYAPQACSCRHVLYSKALNPSMAFTVRVFPSPVVIVQVLRRGSFTLMVSSPRIVLVNTAICFLEAPRPVTPENTLRWNR